MFKIEYFSMFSGIGGFELGIQKAHPEWKCVGYSEIDKFAIQTYEEHFPEHKNYGDATKIKAKELPDFNLLCGGFPCQAFSIAGKRLGFKDTRGTLFFDIARIVKVKRPQYLFLENVKGLLNHSNGRTFATILATLDELGYNAEWQVLNSKYFGVPQNRERVFIIGHLRGKRTRQIFPLRQGSKKVVQREKLREQISNTLRTNYSNTYSNETYVLEGKGMNMIQSHSPRCGNPKKEGTDLLEIRKLTPIECERLQGFPDNWTIGSDKQRYRQCGNAVTVNVIECIARCLPLDTKQEGAYKKEIN